MNCAASLGFQWNAHSSGAGRFTEHLALMMRFIAIAFLFLGVTFPAQPATNEDAAKARNDFDNCVYFSVADQLKDRSVHDLSMVTENGFRACPSEEAILRAFMKKELFFSPEFIDASILRIRVSIKQHVREIATKPLDGRKTWSGTGASQ
jgi:hypothetical protein